MKSITFPEPVLFLEFFVRDVTYYGPNQSAKFPANTLFYSGESTANQEDVPLLGKPVFWEKASGILPNRRYIGFRNGQPCLPETQSRSFQHFVADHPIDAILCQGFESWRDQAWTRHNSHEAYTFRYPGFARCADVVNCSPYRFNVWLQDEKGTLSTDFPESESRQTLEVGSTYLFLARQEQYERNGSWQVITPNINLCLFVKNHGLHQQISLVSESDFAHYDVADLCKAPYKLRDHRKSRFKYLLG